MEREDIYKLPKGAGIYLIRNTINGKCYVGQALKLQKRMKAHWNNCKYPRYQHIALYKAFNKHGIENFEIQVLKSFHDGFDWRIRAKLDELEKKYIEEYDCYNKGYNSTLGGDGGVLGFKHTEETKEYIREKALLQQENRRKDPSNWIKGKNIETNLEVVAHSIKEMSELTGLPEYVISRVANKKQLFAHKVWVFAKYNDEYAEAPEFGTWKYDEALNGQFKTLSNKEEILDYIKANPYCSYGEISQNYRLSKKTFYNYKNELGIKSENKIDTKVNREEFLEFASSHSKEECLHHFNISKRLYYKYSKRYGLRN